VIRINAPAKAPVHTCQKCVGKKSEAKASVGTIFIPLKYHGKTLGIFNLFFDSVIKSLGDYVMKTIKEVEQCQEELVKSIQEEKTKTSGEVKNYQLKLLGFMSLTRGFVG
jgi:hypothetical protein